MLGTDWHHPDDLAPKEGDLGVSAQHYREVKPDDNVLLTLIRYEDGAWRWLSTRAKCSFEEDTWVAVLPKIPPFEIAGPTPRPG